MGGLSYPSLGMTQLLNVKVRLLGTWPGSKLVQAFFSAVARMLQNAFLRLIL